MNRLFLISICLLFIILTGCSGISFKTDKELLQYLNDEDNGYVQNKTINGVKFTLLNRPVDLLVNQEIDSSNVEKIEAIREKYKNYFYMNLSIQKNNQELLSVIPTDKAGFAELVNKLSFDINQNIHLYTSSRDTIQMSDFVYPRTFGMSKSTTILLVYPRNKITLKDDFLVLSLANLNLGTGEVKFKIDTDKINNEPSLF